MVRWGMILKIVALAVVSLLTAACVPPPEPMPLPYRFSIGRFDDKRSADQFGQPAPYQFSQPVFLQELRCAMPYILCGGGDASLHLALTHFEATKFENSHALSLPFQVEGVDSPNRPLASRPIMCSEVQGQGFELDEYAQQVWQDKNLRALTPTARDQTMWGKLFKACVRNLAGQFGQAIVNQDPVRR